MSKKNDVEIARRLIAAYGEVESFVDYFNNFQLLIAVILTAQTTDAQVNKITPELFRQFPDAESLSAAPISVLEELVHSTGFFRMKAKNIKACAVSLVEHFDSDIPETIEELVTLPGVGRKTANVVVGHAFGQPSVAVDTHFGRVAYRLGLTSQKDPVKVESEIKSRIAPDSQSALSLCTNAHGRAICHARKPQCEECFLYDLCLRAGL